MVGRLGGPVELVGDGLEPGPAIFVGQGLAGAHLGDIARGVKPVAVLENPAEPLGQLFRDRAFAGAGDAHDDKRARYFLLVSHENSPEVLPRPPARWSRRWRARGLP